MLVGKGQRPRRRGRRGQRACSLLRLSRRGFSGCDTTSLRRPSFPDQREPGQEERLRVLHVQRAERGNIVRKGSAQESTTEAEMARMDCNDAACCQGKSHPSHATALAPAPADSPHVAGRGASQSGCEGGPFGSGFEARWDSSHFSVQRGPEHYCIAFLLLDCWDFRLLIWHTIRR